MSGEIQCPCQCKHCIGSFLPVKLRSTKASEVCFKVKNFPLEIANNKSLLKRLVEFVPSNQSVENDVHSFVFTPCSVMSMTESNKPWMKFSIYCTKNEIFH